MLYLYTWFTWRNIWLWVIPSIAALHGISIEGGSLGASIQFLIWHCGARAFRHYRGLPVLVGAVLLVGATEAGPLGEHRDRRLPVGTLASATLDPSGRFPSRDIRLCRRRP
jgi:hypothetical protein